MGNDVLGWWNTAISTKVPWSTTPSPIWWLLWGRCPTFSLGLYAVIRAVIVSLKVYFVLCPAKWTWSGLETSPGSAWGWSPICCSPPLLIGRHDSNEAKGHTGRCIGSNFHASHCWLLACQQIGNWLCEYSSIYPFIHARTLSEHATKYLCRDVIYWPIIFKHSL